MNLQFGEKYEQLRAAVRAFCDETWPPRGAEAKLHAHLVGHAEHAKDFVEHRHDHRAAADAEQSGENPGDDAGGDHRRGKLRQFGGGDRDQRFGLATIWLRKVPMAGERISTVSPGFR